MKEESGFFSKTNIIKAIWALLIALVSFLGGKIYQSVYGPQKVVIDSRPTKTDPIYVKLNDGQGNKLNKEILNLKKDVNNIKVYSSYLGNQDNTINKPISGSYELPKNIKGYSVASISGMTDTSKVNSNIKKGEPIIISFVARDVNLLKMATPVIVEILKTISKNEVLQVYRNVYELKNGQNNIVIDVDLSDGNYEMRYGYYKIAELKRKFPNYYSKQFIFKVFE